MTVPVTAVPMPHGAVAYLTGRDPVPDAGPPAVGRAGNLSHRRPHVPSRLAADRRAACRRMGLSVDQLHFMQQVHGPGVGRVTPSTPAGAELPGVDALVSTEVGRALAVQVADCVPLLLSGPGAVAAVHAGRRGVVAGVVGRALDELERLDVPPAEVTGVIGPAIGGCCYEVPEAMRAEVAGDHPAAASETTWGTPSVDLPAAVAGVLRARGAAVHRRGGCTSCDGDQRWFSHRRDPDAGRQLGVVVRRAAA